MGAEASFLQLIGYHSDCYAQSMDAVTKQLLAVVTCVLYDNYLSADS